ncbi:MAG: hypothetical protein HQL25_08685, partial [Candidatus Omnitrophica bacterium]|nr:hypothetical protein [Candidatus Omnitrophota bacterium]
MNDNYNRRSDKKFWRKLVSFIVLFCFAFAQCTGTAFAQYMGGNHSGSSDSTVGSGIYAGGPEQGNFSSSSGSGTLASGEAAYLVFTQSPSSEKHFVDFSRQPVVEIRDVNGNIVSSDNSTVVTLSIFNNPGNGQLTGTASVTAVNGVATFTKLQISRAGNNYTLMASATGLTSAVSTPFDVFAGTGVKIAAVWDDNGRSTTVGVEQGSYTIYAWIEEDNDRRSLAASDTCNDATIWDSTGLPANSITLTFGTGPGHNDKVPDNVNNWCQSAAWTPADQLNSYFIDVSIKKSGILYQTYQPLDLIKPSLSNLANVNWDRLEAIKAKTDTINWEDISVIKSKTDTINWSDLTVLRSDVTSIKGVTGKLDPINWDNLQTMTTAGVNWTDIAQMSSLQINWNDIDALANAGINWSDLNVLTKAGVNWSDFNILSKARINWSDFTVLSNAGINWSDFTVFSKANINWSDFEVLSRTGINWTDFGIMSKARINWADFAWMTGSGVNWMDGVNWDTLAVLTKAGVNWSDLNVMTKAGINWEGWADISTSNIN